MTKRTKSYYVLSAKEQEYIRKLQAHVKRKVAMLRRIYNNVTN